jgi:CheY-like chemotaxis protein
MKLGSEMAMNTRIGKIFNFTKGAPAPEQASTVSQQEPAEASHESDSTKAAVAELIAEMAKSEVRMPRSSPGSGVKVERRHRRRVKISTPVRVRQLNTRHVSEFDLTMTADVSREGILFETSRTTYQRGQEVAVAFPYRAMPGEPVHEQRGQVVRVARASENRYGIAVAFIEGDPTYEVVDALGNPLGQPAGREPVRAKSQGKPLIVLVDADPRVRMLVRSELELRGYAVEAVEDPNSAVALLRHRTPAALICESEAFPGAAPGGGEMSGYDLCVIVRRNAKLAHIPVVLTTRSGLPSDFSTAHALGATVCVAKPYDLKRVVNLLHMLAPVQPQ